LDSKRYASSANGGEQPPGKIAVLGKTGKGERSPEKTTTNWVETGTAPMATTKN